MGELVFQNRVDQSKGGFAPRMGVFFSHARGLFSLQARKICGSSADTGSFWSQDEERRQCRRIVAVHRLVLSNKISSFWSTV